MNLSDKTNSVTPCSFSKSFDEIYRSTQNPFWNDGKSNLSDIRILQAVVQPDEIAHPYESCRFTARIFHERGFPIAHFMLETKNTRIVWLANAREAKIQDMVGEWIRAGHVYIGLLDGTSMITKRKLTVPFAMPTNFDWPVPIDFSSQNAFRRREFIALVTNLVDTAPVSTITVDPVGTALRLISTNVILTEATKKFIESKPYERHALLNETLLRQEDIFGNKGEYAELTDVAGITGNMSSLALPSDAIILTARLQYPDVLEQQQARNDGHLDLTEYKNSSRDLLIFTYQTETVRLVFAANPGDPEAWKAIDSWTKHGKAFLLFQFEDQHVMLTPRFDSSITEIARPDFSNFAFVDSRTRKKNRFVKAYIDDFERESATRDVFFNAGDMDGTCSFQYHLVHWIHTKTTEEYLAFLDEKATWEDENPTAVTNALLPPIGCSGTSSSDALEEMRSKSQTEVHCGIIPTKLLPEEVQGLVLEDKCVCIRVPDDFVDNDELLKSWAIDSYTRIDHEMQRKVTYISFGSGHVEVFGLSILNFLDTIEVQFPVLFLRAESWLLKIYDWHEDFENDDLQVAFFLADNFKYIPEEQAADAEAERNLTQENREKMKRPLLATEYWKFHD
jgi:hypothetical protein